MEDIAEESIDFVIPWVNGNDTEWQREKNEYLKREKQYIDSADIRYRDWGLLKYIFRGIEAYTPWVHKVYFITNGQIPSWMNLEADKLVWVKHQDYIPAEFLPTFSANPIELAVHRIEGLSEQFVYFNDDMFLLRPLSKTHFFRDGIPVMNPNASFLVPVKGFQQFSHMMLNNVMIINSHFSARSVIGGNWINWLSPFRVGGRTAAKNLFTFMTKRFLGFTNPHIPAPYRKDVIKEVWEQEEEFLLRTMKNRFRSNDDVTQYLFYDWHLVTEKFVPEKKEKLGKYYSVLNSSDENERMINAIKKQRYPMICINDVENNLSAEDTERLIERIADAFESILPNKSCFEK